MSIKSVAPAHMIHRKLKVYQVIVSYYVLFATLALMGKIIIYYPSLELVTCLIGVGYVASMTGGAFVGSFIKLPVISTVKLISLNKLLLLLAAICTTCAVFTWAILLSKYSTFINIFANTYQIRYGNIGQDTGLFPIYLTYPSSLLYGAFALSLAAIGWSGKQKYKLAACCFFVLIFAVDLSLFGRIGMVYSIFCVIGFLTIYKIKIFTTKNVFILLLIFLILVTPRIIRRGGEGLLSFDTFSQASYMKVKYPAQLSELVDSYTTFFSSLYALDYYLQNDENTNRTYGTRTFTPLFRIINRISGGGYSMSTIDDNALNISTLEHNVYTVIRDFYGDFGIIGTTLLPFLIGLCFGICFNYQGIIFDAIKIYTLAWLFYTPIYNAFSFGSFLISFVFLLVISLFIYQGKKVETFNGSASTGRVKWQPK